MVVLSRLATVLAVTAALAWFLPDLYRRATQPERVRVNAYYSASAGQFLIRTDGFDKSTFSDEAGRSYSQEQHRQLLPFLYYSDLAKHGQFPPQVAGIPVTVDAARREMQVLQLNPREWNAPQLNLHTLFRSAPWGSRLALPDDMFRVEPAGLTFIRAADGVIDGDKSNRFTRALDEAGVRWPLKGLGGNPSPLKEFDEGYVLVDAASRVFHLKMVRGQPECRDTGLVVPGNVRAVVVDEHARREILGVAVTDDAVHLVTYANTLVRLPLDGFDADGGMALLRSDPLNRTVATADVRDRLRNPMRLVATGTDYQPGHRFDLPLPQAFRERMALARTVSSALFPFAIIQAVPEDGRVLLRIEPAASLPVAAGDAWRRRWSCGCGGAGAGNGRRRWNWRWRCWAACRPWWRCCCSGR
ncbi:MAG: DUF4857 domain-containing protein [Magnetospirillum sp.]|nr:DUF4857 domain-containing protein [Magnetospirillum sp.]